MKFLSFRNKYIYIAALVCLVITAIFFIKKSSTKFTSTHSEHASHMDHMSEMNHMSGMDSKYEAFHDEMINLVKEENPTKAFERIKEAIKTDDVVLKNCHMMVHEIGHISFDKYKDFNKTMEYNDDICDSGYIHGVMEKYFLTVTDVYKTINTVCKDQEETVFTKSKCYHGVGHGIMYFTHDDLPKALSICKSFNDESKSENCRNGVFMENFSTHHKEQLSKFLDQDHPIFPCLNLEQEDKYLCYYYVPSYYLSLHPQDYKGMFEMCKESEKGFEDWCDRGIGVEAVKDNIRYPKKVEEICMTGNEFQKNQCLTGMIRIYMDFFREKGQEKVDCNILESSNRKLCETIKDQYKQYSDNN